MRSALFLRRTAVAALLAATSTHAATIVVDSTADDHDLGPNGNCTLREATLSANQNFAVDGCTAGQALPITDRIEIPAGSYLLTIGGTFEVLGETGDLNLTEDTVVVGAGATTTLIDSSTLVGGSWKDRVFGILESAATVEISDLTIQGGTHFEGGGVHNLGSLALRRCTLRNNRAASDSGQQGLGGAIFNAGTLLVHSSTLSGNTAEGAGGLFNRVGTATVVNSTLSGNTRGAMWNGYVFPWGPVYAPGTIDLRHVTFSENTTTHPAVGSAMYSEGGVITISNTLLDGYCTTALAGAYTSLGGNLESDGDTCDLLLATDQVNVLDPVLGPLQLNGGSTATHELLSGSPALDIALDSTCLRQDQRATVRPQGPACDIGAFERVASSGGCTASVVRTADGRLAHVDLGLLLMPLALVAATRRKKRPGRER